MELKNIEQLARALEHDDIPYMIVGGQAFTIHAIARFTEDIDVILGVSPDRCSRILQLVGEFGWSPLPNDPVAFAEKNFVLPCQHDKLGIRLDLIFSVTLFEQEALENAVNIEIDGVSIKFASKEDLAVFKIFAGRARDLEDVRILLLTNADLDRAYVENWLGRFDGELDLDLMARWQQVCNEAKKTESDRS